MNGDYFKEAYQHSELYGDKVKLRVMKESDAEYVVAWRNNPEILKWMFNDKKFTIQEHIKWFLSTRSQRIDYIICDLENSLPIGTVNYSNFSEGSAEAGKLLGNTAYWGGGFAKDAFSLWIDFGFNVLGLSRIYVKTMINNISNIKLNEKLGFVVVKTELKVLNSVELQYVEMELLNTKRLD